MRPLIAKIQRETADYYGVAIESMTAWDRRPEVLKPRHVAMYIARRLTRHSFPEISHRFGKRDHTTAMNAYREVQKRIYRSHGVELQVATLIDRLTGVGE